MTKTRELEKTNVFYLIGILNEKNIDKGEIIRAKTSKKTGEKIEVVYYKYIDCYIVQDSIFINQLKAIDYFNKL